MAGIASTGPGDGRRVDANRVSVKDQIKGGQVYFNKDVSDVAI